MANRVSRSRVAARHDADAAERKRLRDRVAQQNLRNKRNQHIQSLEQQVKLCNELHTTNSHNGDEIRTFRELRAENAALRERQEHLQALFQSFKDVFEPPPTSPANTDNCHTPTQFSGRRDEPPRQHTPPSSSTVTSEPPRACQPNEAISTSTPPCHPLPPNKIVEVVESVPHYSIWLAGIGASTDGESEAQTSHLEVDHSTAEVDNIHSTPGGTQSFVMQPPASLFDAQRSQIMTDMWCSRLPTPHYLKGVPPTPIRTDFLNTFNTYDPFLYARQSSMLDVWAEDSSVEEIPVWARIPVRTSGPNDVRRLPWDANIRIIFDSPEVPSPMDILFGSNQNPLASSLQRSIKNYYQGNPERLAIGWLVYQYIKWRTQPSVERYALLPSFLKPIFEQIWMPHPGSIDLIIWESLRLKMLKNFDKYDMAKFIRSYCRCLRLRWHWDEDVLVTNGEGKHILRPDFVDRFMTEAGWGLKPEFVSHYPELFEGEEWEQIAYNPGPRQIS